MSVGGEPKVRERSVRAVAALAGWVAFGVAPDGWGWAGMAIIGISGAASAWLNVRAAAHKLRPVGAVQADTIAQ